MDILTQAFLKHDGTTLPLNEILCKETSNLIDICKTRNSKLMFFKDSEAPASETTIKIFNDGTYETDDVERANFHKEQTLMQLFKFCAKSSLGPKIKNIYSDVMEVIDDCLIMKTMPFDLCSAMPDVTFSSEKLRMTLITNLIGQMHEAVDQINNFGICFNDCSENNFLVDVHNKSVTFSWLAEARKNHDVDYSVYMQCCTLKLYDFEYSYLVDPQRLLTMITLLILSLQVNENYDVLNEIKQIVGTRANPSYDDLIVNYHKHICDVFEKSMILMRKKNYHDKPVKRIVDHDEVNMFKEFNLFYQFCSQKDLEDAEEKMKRDMSKSAQSNNNDSFVTASESSGSTSSEGESSSGSSSSSDKCDKNPTSTPTITRRPKKSFMSYEDKIRTILDSHNILADQMTVDHLIIWDQKNENFIPPNIYNVLMKNNTWLSKHFGWSLKDGKKRLYRIDPYQIDRYTIACIAIQLYCGDFIKRADHKDSIFSLFGKYPDQCYDVENLFENLKLRYEEKLDDDVDQEYATLSHDERIVIMNTRKNLQWGIYLGVIKSMCPC